MHFPKTRAALTPAHLPALRTPPLHPETIMPYAPPLHTQRPQLLPRVFPLAHQAPPSCSCFYVSTICERPEKHAGMHGKRVFNVVSPVLCRLASIAKACDETLLFDHARHPVSSHLLIGLSHPSAGGKFAAAVQGIARRSRPSCILFFQLFFCLIVSVGVSGRG